MHLAEALRQPLSFLRKGYFYYAPEDAAGGKRVYSRIVSLKETWAKQNR